MLLRAVFVVLACLAYAARAADSSGVEFSDTMEQRMAACAGCHGKQGEGGRADEYYPRIAGKPVEYLYRQLAAFRDGRRTYPQMVYFTRFLSDDYLREMASYYAKLAPEYPAPSRPAATREALARGEVLVRKGDAARGVPACASCHGTALTGTLPATPGLVGLPPDYVAAQFGAWRSGIRHASEPDCMAKIAQRMSGADVAAVAAWLATQPGTHAAPAAADPKRKPPMACGDGSAVQATSSPSPAPGTGEYLARAGDCIACHTARGGEPFAGGLEMRTPFGVFATPNITPDRETGIGAWTSDDFYRALHEGKSKDGTLLYPAFPYPSYTKVTRADSDAIYAYLRSVPAVKRKNAPHRIAFPYNRRSLLLGWRALYFTEGEYRQDPSQSTQWNRGAYLVQGLGHCDACHTSRNALGATSKDRELRGGLVPQQDWYAPSLTSAHESGLGQWDVADIVSLLRTGVSARGAVFGPMAQVVHDSLQHASEADARAMATYLKSLAAGDRAAGEAARPFDDAARASYDAGGKLYDRHCKSCHGSGGQGMPPAYPALAGNQALAMDEAVNPIRMTLFGGFPPSTGGNPRPFGMPPFAYMLSDAEVAAVVTYVRRAWGNRAGAVSAFEVAKYRSVPVD